MTLLHVGCLPFPTYQGTQAALASMLEASTELFGDAHLVTYAGRAYDTNPRYTIHRIADRPRVESLRSGPSWSKAVLDVRMVAEIRRLAARLRPHAVLAHHIEAAMAALAAGARPVYYVAHTALEPELPTYFSTVFGRPVARAGGVLERLVCARASRVAAVAPSLARMLGPRCEYLPVPWTATRTWKGTVDEARAAFGVDRDACVALYAGNLDRYQGWESLIEALAHLRRTHPTALLLVATHSDPTPVVQAALRAGLRARVRIATLDGEAARARAHLAADLAWIPRQTPGGLPIKLLDALSRGLPVVASRRATAGLDLGDGALCVRDDDPAALAQGARCLLDHRDKRARQVAAGHRYLARAHSIESFGLALERLTGLAHGSTTRVRPLASAGQSL